MHKLRKYNKYIIVINDYNYRGISIVTLLIIFILIIRAVFTFSKDIAVDFHSYNFKLRFFLIFQYLSYSRKNHTLPNKHIDRYCLQSTKPTCLEKAWNRKLSRYFYDNRRKFA